VGTLEAVATGGAADAIFVRDSASGRVVLTIGACRWLDGTVNTEVTFNTFEAFCRTEFILPFTGSAGLRLHKTFNTASVTDGAGHASVHTEVSVKFAERAKGCLGRLLGAEVSWWANSAIPLSLHIVESTSRARELEIQSTLRAVVTSGASDATSFFASPEFSVHAGLGSGESFHCIGIERNKCEVQKMRFSTGLLNVTRSLLLGNSLISLYWFSDCDGRGSIGD